jgi:signal transduction histidine kinase
MHSDKKLFLLYFLAGIMAFALLSFAHDGFRTDRAIQSYYLPISVGAGVGGMIAYFRNKIEARTRMYERRLSKEREDAAMGRAAAAIAHEVRNPLNALAIGLQRLQLEAGSAPSTGSFWSSCSSPSGQRHRREPPALFQAKAARDRVLQPGAPPRWIAGSLQAAVR